MDADGDGVHRMDAGGDGVISRAEVVAAGAEKGSMSKLSATEGSNPVMLT